MSIDDLDISYRSTIDPDVLLRVISGLQMGINLEKKEIMEISITRVQYLVDTIKTLWNLNQDMDREITRIMFERCEDANQT